MISQANQIRLLEGIHDQEPVSGLTHNFYRYPARFSPIFARAVIESFTKPGDVVYDPFMGGGTTLVEAAALGRRCIGTDISSLAVFIAKAKTTVLSNQQLQNVDAWIKMVLPILTTRYSVARAEGWIQAGYQRNLNDRSTWRLRKLLEIGLSEITELVSNNEQQFARCILLKTAQWALDCRTDIPSESSFQNQLLQNAATMIDAACEYARQVAKAPCKFSVQCLHRSAIGIDEEPAMASHRPIKLVLTSPPYPGVHVLYHRWQIKGRKETAAPFWIAGTLDGDGASFYTFGGRKQHSLSKYFDQAKAAFTSISKIVQRDTVVVQMIAFSEPSWQLPKYLEAMELAGFSEAMMPGITSPSDGRTWRSVPNRKWYASKQGHSSSSKEVVLFHKLRQR